MKINQKMLNIPPYISTSWKNVAALYVDNQQNKPVLSIALLNGTCVQIPNLQSGVLEAVFSMHSQYLEQEQSLSNKEKMTLPKGVLGIIPGMELVNTSELAEDPESLQNLTTFLKTLSASFKGILPGIDLLLQHNSQLTEAPLLSKDILEHIFSFLKSLDDGSTLNGFLTKPEHPHCNCPYCQISRFAQNKAEEIEEEVSDKDLKFKTWDIEQTGDKLFAVTNPFDANEKYNVYIGDPIGCTCGEMRCKHIHAVLSADIA
ncbi:MAG TPA: hypothetical protein VGZ69_06115 [Candidatus Rhabdochlamydia sp.]|jgi:hypothetical protein|nr:hypothetical protein [Candidatus Rhabdochlamydia sp.]